MPRIIVDTSGWANLIDQNEPFHSFVIVFYRKARTQGQYIITTNYVLAELVALTVRPLRIPRSVMIAFIENLKISSFVEIIHINEYLDEQAWTLLKNRRDKEWSLVDCASFIVMQQQRITEALTEDHHFEQFGFVRLLR